VVKEYKGSREYNQDLYPTSYLSQQVREYIWWSRSINRVTEYKQALYPTSYFRQQVREYIGSSESMGDYGCLVSISRVTEYSTRISIPCSYLWEQVREYIGAQRAKIGLCSTTRYLLPLFVAQALGQRVHLGSESINRIKVYNQDLYRTWYLKQQVKQYIWGQGGKKVTNIMRIKDKRKVEDFNKDLALYCRQQFMECMRGRRVQM
jgi:hypothetical protein